MGNPVSKFTDGRSRAADRQRDLAGVARLSRNGLQQ
jgi:hypothetical protein